MNAKQLEEYARSLLVWYDLDNDHPHRKLIAERGGCVSRLMLVYQDKEPNDLAHIAQLSTGEFWTFENNKMIVCRRYSGKRFAKIADARDDLYAWVLSEVIRVMKATMKFSYSILSAFKKRDAEAFEGYLKSALMTVIFGKDTSFKPTFKRGFQAGVDWILRSEGVVRRPSWARYVVQNQDGSQTWFEHEPADDMHSGRWLCATGRHMDVQVHPELWTGSLRKLS